jgi:hypothetical protein
MADGVYKFLETVRFFLNYTQGPGLACFFMEGMGEGV